MVSELVNDLKTGVSECPACGGKLERGRKDEALTNPDGFPTGKTRTHLFYLCHCGWCVLYQPPNSNYLSVATLVLSQPGLELPKCRRGHSLSWSLQRRRGKGLDLLCVHFSIDRLDWCGLEKHVWFGERPGFLTKPGEFNATKSVVLRALWEHRERGGLTSVQLRKITGLTDGQVIGYLRRGTSAIHPLIQKVGDVYQPPNHKVGFYKITTAGLQWVRWVMEQDYHGEEA